jgi:hypothetical protein
VLLPWGVRNYALTGDPFFTLQLYAPLLQTRSFPGEALYRSLWVDIPSPLRLALDHPEEILEKVGRNLRLAGSLPFLWGGSITVLALLSFVRPFGSPGLRRLRQWGPPLLGAYFLLLCLMQPQPERLVLFLPLTTLLAASAVEQAIRELRHWINRGSQRRPRPRRSERWVWVGLVAAGLVTVGEFLMPWVQVWGNPRSASVPSVNGSYHPEVVVASDHPWEVAWRGHCPTLWLPYGETDFRRMDDLAGVRVLYLTQRLSSLSFGDWYGRLHRAYHLHTSPLEGFRFDAETSDDQAAVFYRTRETKGSA